MSSLNRRHQAADLLRAAARMRLEREAAARVDALVVSTDKPVLHLFGGNQAVTADPPVAPDQPQDALAAAPTVPQDAQDGSGGGMALVNVPAAPATPVAAPEAVQDRANERFRWRCYLCQLFARQYQPDAARAKQARDFAYSKRAMIHAAFDAGRLKADVLNDLRVGFETPLVIGRDVHEAYISRQSEGNLVDGLGP